MALINFSQQFHTVEVDGKKYKFNEGQYMALKMRWLEDELLRKSYPVFNQLAFSEIPYELEKVETRGRKPKDQEKRDKTINLRVSSEDLEILDGICAARAGEGKAFSSRWDVIKEALQEKYYDYNW